MSLIIISQARVNISKLDLDPNVVVRYASFMSGAVIDALPIMIRLSGG
jgi:hypothetical protein